MSPKQSAIMQALRAKGAITLDDAVELIGKDIYANERFHVGNILSNMVNRKMIARTAPGHFALPDYEEYKAGGLL